MQYRCYNMCVKFLEFWNSISLPDSNITRISLMSSILKLLTRSNSRLGEILLHGLAFLRVVVWEHLLLLKEKLSTVFFCSQKNYCKKTWAQFVEFEKNNVWKTKYALFLFGTVFFHEIFFWNLCDLSIFFGFPFSYRYFWKFFLRKKQSGLKNFGKESDFKRIFTQLSQVIQKQVFVFQVKEIWVWWRIWFFCIFLLFK